MSEDREMSLFNNEKMFITSSIMLEFGYLNNLIDWAGEDLYRWADKTRENKEPSCTISEYFQCKGEYLEQCFNNALVLSVYAILEDGLKRISECYKENIETKVKIVNFRFRHPDMTKELYSSSREKIYIDNKEFSYKSSSTLEKYATYLQKIGIDIAKNSNYDLLRKWTRVRNSIIHAGEEIKDKSIVEEIKEIVKVDDILEEVSAYSFIIDNNTLKEFINLVEQYLRSIFNYEITNVKLQRNRL